MQENFVATVSHDLRTPLGFIKGYTTTLLREDTDWDVPTFREFLGIIDDEADRLQELIDNLLESSRLQSGTLQMNLQLVRLDVVLRDMIQRSQLRDINITIELEIENQGVMVKADPMRLGQVFDNLINNASKYAPDTKVIVNLVEDEGNACITVQDNGPGIDEEHLEKFEERLNNCMYDSCPLHGQRLQLPCHIRWYAGCATAVAISLLHPLMQCLRRTADLRRNRRHRRPARTVFAFVIQNQPHTARARTSGENLFVAGRSP